MMESVFGHDLRDIRIHSDAAAAASADAVGALAYTVGSDVVLGRGYRGRSVAGSELLAHELAHSLQQRRGASGGGTLAIDDNPALEAEADRWAGRAKMALTRTQPAKASHGADHRCPAGQECSAEDLVDHQGSGTTTCDKFMGRMDVTVTEHCGGNCVAQHEAVHVADRQECCRRVSACQTAAKGDRAQEAACRAAYDTWHPQLSDWTECRAYTKEVACLTSFIAANCNAAAAGAAGGGLIGAVTGGVGGLLFGGPLGAVAGAVAGGALGAEVGAVIGAAQGGSVSEDCCKTLRRELAFAQGEMASRCPGVNEPCPFNADGSII